MNRAPTVYAVSGIQTEQVSSMSLNASIFGVDKDKLPFWCFRDKAPIYEGGQVGKAPN